MKSIGYCRTWLALSERFGGFGITIRISARKAALRPLSSALVHLRLSLGVVLLPRIIFSQFVRKGESKLMSNTAEGTLLWFLAVLYLTPFARSPCAFKRHVVSTEPITSRMGVVYVSAGVSFDAKLVISRPVTFFADPGEASRVRTRA